MFVRGLLVTLSILLTLGYVATSRASTHANSPANSIEHLEPIPLTTFPVVVTVLKSANVRAGPGTEYAIISAARPGQRLNVLGCNIDCSWYLLAEDCWIAAFLAEPEQPVTTVPAFPTVAIPGNAPVPTIVVGVPITVGGTATPAVRCPQTAGDVVTYAGPATFYPVVDLRPVGECLAIIGRNAAGDWYQLVHGMWIDAGAVLYAPPIEFLPITDQIITATPPPPPTPVIPVAFSAEEQAYIDFMAVQIATYAAAWATLERQLTLAEANPLVMQTDDWLSQTNAAIAVIRLTSEGIHLRVPPPRLQPHHAQMLVAANYYDEAMLFVVEGYLTQDVSRFDVARKCVMLANEAIARGATVLQSIYNAAQYPPTATPVPAPPRPCDPNYTGACVPVYPPAVTCDTLPQNFTRAGSDPHGLDPDSDGIACESPSG
jgi:uncharacterized protein YraI